MDVIRKVCFVFVLVALVSFVGGLAGAEDSAKININTATMEELTSLQGIGEKKAESIVEHREKAGSFATIEDLKDVNGVGDKIFDKIKDQITVE
jgi:competence protein ComEA